MLTDELGSMMMLHNSALLMTAVQHLFFSNFLLQIAIHRNERYHGV